MGSGALGNLARIVAARSGRASSWDRTGGNRDYLVIPPGAKATLAEIDGPGKITHIWMTLRSDDALHLRKLVLRAWWDGEEHPSIETPIGDFFGMGHARTTNWWSQPLQMAPEEGKAFSCFFPMPFTASARWEVTNDCDADAIVYYYIDYERYQSADAVAGLGQFHAQWRRQAPCDGISDAGMDNEEYSFGGVNPDGAGNYVLLEAEGTGHYVGCHLDVENLRYVPEDVFNWYGEGDDMIFIDGEVWPPSLHGTGTEDYFGTAWCPKTPFHGPYHGVILPGGPNWSGQITLYRYHIEDPVRFSTSIRVTIEHGHANRRSDDYSSTAYWYQTEPHLPFPAFPDVAARLPRRGRA
ncbi:MAG: hypothetical protein DCC58_11210 [Chloroflexi bacterium]|nr:MAG: hypothetical protein DCC58_11210 [Chloroflexota bacterium]